MASAKVDCVVKANALTGEGPVWEESERSLLYVDICGQNIHRWDPNTDQIQSLDTGWWPRRRAAQRKADLVEAQSSPLARLSGDEVAFAVPRSSGGYVAGVGRNIVAVDWSSQTMTSLAAVDKDKPNNQLSDGKADPFGRLLTGKSFTLLHCYPDNSMCCDHNYDNHVLFQEHWGRRCDRLSMRDTRELYTQWRLT